jgi:hypothetical protein
MQDLATRATSQEAHGLHSLRKKDHRQAKWPLSHLFSHYGYRGAIALAYLGVAFMVFFVLFQACFRLGAQCVDAGLRLSQTEQAH